MCLWLLTACLGLMPASPQQSVLVVQSVTPILQPTTAATTAATTTTTTTTARPGTLPGQANMTNPGAALPGATMPAPTMPAASMMPAMTPPAITNPPQPNPPSPTNNPSAPLIDPRFGATPPAYGAPIQGYTAPLPAGDGTVRFPQRRRRSVDRQLGRWRRTKRQNNCFCVAIGNCPGAGAGLIDFRIVTPGAQCPQGQIYCCTSAGGAAAACGTRQNIASNKVAGPGQADYGEYPWMALILTQQNDYIAGGVLIDQYNVLTVTHRLSTYLVAGTAPNVKVRLGEWDTADQTEPYPYQEYTVRRVFTHPQYNPSTLQYDACVLRLATPVPYLPAAGSAPTINRVCLPGAPAENFVGQRCWVTGWGRNAFGQSGQYQRVLKEVEVPVVAAAACQSQLQAARLGAGYVLDTTSFLCAGGEANKDSCTGDGGSGLVCQSNGAWSLLGLVSWGLGCAAPSVPGVYVNVPALLPWIQQQVSTV